MNCNKPNENENWKAQTLLMREGEGERRLSEEKTYSNAEQLPII